MGFGGLLFSGGLGEVKYLVFKSDGAGGLCGMDEGIGCVCEGFPRSTVPLLSPHHPAPTVFGSFGASSQTLRSRGGRTPLGSGGEPRGQPFSSTLLHPTARGGSSRLGVSPGQGTRGLVLRGQLGGVDGGFKFKMKGHTNQMDL